mgnify:CR=1 FL=1
MIYYIIIFLIFQWCALIESNYVYTLIRRALKTVEDKAHKYPDFVLGLLYISIDFRMELSPQLNIKLTCSSRVPGTVVRDAYLRPTTVDVLVVRSIDCLEQNTSADLVPSAWKTEILLLY